MSKIQCAFNDLSEVINDEHLPCAVYIDLNTASLETYDDDEAAMKKNALIRLPYREELYTENSASGDYILETGISIPHRMGARRYLGENKLSPDFDSFYGAALVIKLGEWFKENGFEIVFDA